MRNSAVPALTYPRASTARVLDDLLVPALQAALALVRLCMCRYSMFPCASVMIWTSTFMCLRAPVPGETSVARRLSRQLVRQFPRFRAAHLSGAPRRCPRCRCPPYDDRLIGGNGGGGARGESNVNTMSSSEGVASIPGGPPDAGCDDPLPRAAAGSVRGWASSPSSAFDRCDRTGRLRSKATTTAARWKGPQQQRDPSAAAARHTQKGGGGGGIERARERVRASPPASRRCRRRMRSPQLAS